MSHATTCAMRSSETVAVTTVTMQLSYNKLTSIASALSLILGIVAIIMSATTSNGTSPSPLENPPPTGLTMSSLGAILISINLLPILFLIVVLSKKDKPSQKPNNNIIKVTSSRVTPTTDVNKKEEEKEEALQVVYNSDQARVAAIRSIEGRSDSASKRTRERIDKRKTLMSSKPLPELDIKNLKATFATYDTNKDGSLDENELHTWVNQILSAPTKNIHVTMKANKDTVRKLIGAYDTDGDKEIGFRELCAWLSKVQKMPALERKKLKDVKGEATDTTKYRKALVKKQAILFAEGVLRYASWGGQSRFNPTQTTKKNTGNNNNDDDNDNDTMAMHYNNDGDDGAVAGEGIHDDVERMANDDEAINPS